MHHIVNELNIFIIIIIIMIIINDIQTLYYFGQKDAGFSAPFFFSKSLD